MAAHERLAHDADGRTPGERARRAGYDYCAIAENIAYQYGSAGFATEDLAQRFASGWQRSRAHRENLLDRDVLETAAAVARSRRSGRYYAVQLFGRPSARCR
jgi:uncharacterized protein YkwD